MWTDQAGGIWTAPIGGTPKQLSDQKHPDFAFSLVAAGDQIFATARHGILMIDLAAGSVARPYRVAADPQAIYVTSRDDNRIVRIPKSTLAP